MSDTENQIDLNSPPSTQEVADWVSKLSPEGKTELRRQQIQHAAVTRQAPVEIDWGSLSAGEFEAQKAKLFKNG